MKASYTAKPWYDEIEILIGKVKAKAWFAGADLSGSTLIVRTRFKRDWIKDRYKTQCKKVGIDEIIVQEKMDV